MICMDFQWLHVATKKHQYLIHFTEEVIDKIVCHEFYSFLDGFFWLLLDYDRPQK
jgi:hypothetical protein